MVTTRKDDVEGQACVPDARVNGGQHTGRCERVREQAWNPPAVFAGPRRPCSSKVERKYQEEKSRVTHGSKLPVQFQYLGNALESAPVVLPHEFRLRVATEKNPVEPYTASTERDLNRHEYKRNKAKFLHATDQVESCSVSESAYPMPCRKVFMRIDDLVEEYRGVS